MPNNSVDGKKLLEQFAEAGDVHFTPPQVTVVLAAMAEFRNREARPVQQPAPNKFASGRDSAESEQNKAGTNSSDPSLRNEPLAISVQQPATEPLIKELREARTAWHKDFGVPVSFPYARFLNAIGAVEDALALREPMLESIEDYRSGYSCGYSDAKNGTRMRDKDAADLFFGIGAPDILDHKERP